MFLWFFKLRQIYTTWTSSEKNSGCIEKVSNYKSILMEDSRNFGTFFITIHPAINSFTVRHYALTLALDIILTFAPKPTLTLSHTRRLKITFTLTLTIIRFPLPLSFYPFNYLSLAITMSILLFFSLAGFRLHLFVASIGISLHLWLIWTQKYKLKN